MHTFRGGAEWALTQYDWVSMNDKNNRPVHDQKILLWTSFFDHPEYRRWHKDWNNDGYIDYYYMPLPEPPKTEQA